MESGLGTGGSTVVVSGLALLRTRSNVTVSAKEENTGEKQATESVGIGESIKLTDSAVPPGTNTGTKADGSGDSPSGMGDSGSGPNAGSSANQGQSVRKRIGSARVKTARERIAAGTASDTDKETVRIAEEQRTAKAPAVEAPPSTANAGYKLGQGPKHAWLDKYGDKDGRELLCTELAQLLQEGMYKLGRYIKDNGGSPILDPDKEEHGLRFYNNNVRAFNNLLPPHVTAAPEIIMMIGVGTQTVQGALTVYRVKKKKLGDVQAVTKALTATDAIKADATKDDRPVGEVTPEETKKAPVKPVRERDRV
jgi:hypothetical protein